MSNLNTVSLCEYKK